MLFHFSSGFPLFLKNNFPNFHSTSHTGMEITFDTVEYCSSLLLGRRSGWSQRWPSRLATAHGVARFKAGGGGFLFVSFLFSSLRFAFLQNSVQQNRSEFSKTHPTRAPVADMSRREMSCT
ncbi:hypothetical protein Tsp_11149 [Trichinella spiralis]|uniref:hypothetical protein n=1 Tax=Trichinella spiralis TaxID=6334 RepID=UPI0001EFEAEC|nr:hypothetical protein Tsp_11149 [Trichinella spiralis]